MPRSFHGILNDCLLAIQRGETVESCLARYPKQAYRLRPLLETAQDLRYLPIARPRAQAQEAGWQRFYGQAMTMRRGRKAATLGWWKPLSIAASGLFVFMITGGSLAFAASKAGPNDQLYPVKLATEEARIWFAFDDGAKTELLLSQANTRIDEIAGLVNNGQPVPDDVINALANRVSRAATITADNFDDDPLKLRTADLAARHEDVLVTVRDRIAGPAQDDYVRALAKVHTARLRLDGIAQAVKPADVQQGITQISGIAEPSPSGEHVWIVGGLEVEIDNRAIGAENLESGQLANVLVARGSDNRLRALNLTASDPSQVSEERSVVTGQIESLQSVAVVIGGRTIPLSEQLQRTFALNQGQTVQIDISSLDGSAVAVKAVNAPDAITNSLIIEGVADTNLAQQDKTMSLQVAGQTIVITPATLINANAGAIKKGAYVRLDAQRISGKLLARSVTVLNSKEAKAGNLIIIGPFQSIIDIQWQVGGLQIDPPLYQAAPATGTIVRLEAKQIGTRLQASSARFILSPNATNLVTTTGYILQAGPSQWKVGALTFNATSDTVIDSKPVIGARAVIWGQPGANGIDALYIDVLDDTAVLAKLQNIPQPTLSPTPASGNSGNQPQTGTPLPGGITLTPTPATVP